jgi:hypothetical protein
VPEKRNIGTIAKRKTGTNAPSCSRVAAYAAIGAAKAKPRSTHAGSASTASGECRPPNAAITAR